MKLYRKDIAKIAGVSEQTVSYILNGTRTFSEETKNKVLQAVKETGYKPDEIAKGLAKKHLNLVAILIDNFSNPIYSEILDGFQRAAYESGYVVIVADLRNRGEKIISDLIAMRVAGIYITLGILETCVRILPKLESSDIKVVFGNKFETEEQRYVYVETDKRKIMEDIVNFLVDCGHKKIVYLSGLDVHSRGDLRYQSFLDYTKKQLGSEGVVFQNVAPYATDMDAGKRLAKQFIESGESADAIVATNDLMAIGAISELTKEGIKVPDDISVMGIDNIDMAKYSVPALTTIGFDKKKYGRRIFYILKGMIEGKDGASFSETLDSEIYVRDSVKNRN